METTIYREEVPLTQWALIMIGLFITVLTPTILLEVLAVYKEPWSLTLYVALDLLFILIMLNFRKMVITIDSTYLLASFGLIKKKIILEEIKACEPITASLSVFTGMGIRYGGDGSLAYLPSLGDAVRLSFENGRPFVFSTRNQQQVLDILNSHTASKSKITNR
ncbi:hypothetical protein ACFL0D_00110 [Thermoproteota archaeon]